MLVVWFRGYRSERLGTVSKRFFRLADAKVRLYSHMVGMKMAKP